MVYLHCNHDYIMAIKKLGFELFLGDFEAVCGRKKPCNCRFINEITENASSRKLGNRKWFCQPLVHIVTRGTRALRALVPCNCMNSWLAKPISGFPTSWKRYIPVSNNGSKSAESYTRGYPSRTKLLGWTTLGGRPGSPAWQDGDSGNPTSRVHCRKEQM